jgi:hypothetical protein
MDWTLTIAASSLILNALVIGFWKPWLGAYGGEKGKNLARKEDLDAILAEVRAVTIMQKEIEHKLSSDLWDRQIRWNQKRDMYAQLLQAIRKISDACAGLIAWIPNQQHDDPALRQHAKQTISSLLDTFNSAHSDFTYTAALMTIFGSKECNDAISIFRNVRGTHKFDLSIEWATSEHKSVMMMEAVMPLIAKKDLGIPVT